MAKHPKAVVSKQFKRSTHESVLARGNMVLVNIQKKSDEISPCWGVHLRFFWMFGHDRDPNRLVMVVNDCGQ